MVQSSRHIIYKILNQHSTIAQQYLQRPAVLVDPKGIKRIKGRLMKDEKEVGTYRHIIYMMLNQCRTIAEQYLQRLAVLVDPKGIKRIKGD